MTAIWDRTRERISAKLEAQDAIFGGKLQEPDYLEGK
jgi:hypothetical protein